MADRVTPSGQFPAWMVVYTTYNAPEAHIVAGRLQSEGVKAWVHQEPFGSAMGITFGQLGEVRVVVNAEDYDTALAILNEPIDPLLSDEDDDLLEPPDDEYDE
jgi:hypothetical protein